MCNYMFDYMTNMSSLGVQLTIFPNECVYIFERIKIFASWIRSVSYLLAELNRCKFTELYISLNIVYWTDQKYLEQFLTNYCMVPLHFLTSYWSLFLSLHYHLINVYRWPLLGKKILRGVISFNLSCYLFRSSLCL